MPLYPHPIIQAKMDALLSANEISTIWGIDDIPVIKARQIIGLRVVILGAWELESEFPDSALVHVEDGHATSHQDLVIVRGNAGRQALYLHNRKMTPVSRILTSIKIDENELFYWRKDRAA